MAPQPSTPTTYETQYHVAHLSQDSARPVVWSAICDYLSPYISPDAHVMELGAGYCDWINQITAARKIAVDLWSELPHYAAPGVETIQHDLTQGLPPGIGSEQFDAVLASNFLEHLNPDMALNLCGEVWHVLKPGGRFLIIQPNFRYAYRHYFDDYTHRSVFTAVSLPNLLRAQRFTVERVQAKFLPYSMRDSRLPIRAWLVRAYLHSPFKPFAGQMLVIGRKPI